MAGSYTRRINLYINGKEVKNNIASIKAEMSKLINEQARMTRGTSEYVEAGKRIRVLKSIVQEHTDQLKTVSKSWNFENLSHAMNKYFLAVSTFVAGFSGLLYSGKKAITMFAEFDDKVSDVRKTTSLTREQVVAMNEELKKVDTRTAQLELLDLGRIAGKLGINAEKEVEGFIKASDKVVVALKEDLGNNAEEAVRQIGKLVTVFGVRDRFGIEEAINKTGSALNELGMASTASEGYIVEFTKRVAGVAPTAKISIQNVMGLAATLDHLGQTSEVSSTAYSQVVTGMFKDTGAYAKAARMDVKDFSDLLKKDANEAFIKLLEGLNNNDAGMEELIKSMGDLDMEGKRAISVIGVLSNNVKILRDQQAISNREFKKGTSLQNEFNVKNNNAQAILEKKQKALSNLAIELGEKLMPALTVSTSGFSYFVKAGIIMTDFLIKHSGTIIKLTASIAAYTIATKLATMWQARQSNATLVQIIATKAKIIIENAAIAATQLYAAATMLLTGNIKGATQAMRVFSTVTKMNPIGLLIGLLTLAAGALYTYWQRTKEVVKEGMLIGKETIEIQKQKTAQIIEEKNELNSLVRQILITNENSSIRKNLIEELQKLYPDFLGNIDAEKVSNEQLATQLGIVNKSYGEKIRLAALNARSEAITKKMVENEGRKIEIEDELQQKSKTAITPGTDEEKELIALNSEYEKLNKENKLYQIMLTKMDDKKLSIKKNTYSNTIDWWTKKTNELNFSINETKDKIKRAREQNDEESVDHFTKALANYEAELKIAEVQLEAVKKTEKTPKKPNGADPPPSGDPNKNKWSLNSDINFLKESLKLKQDYGKGVIKTEEDLNTKLRELEISYLKDRIKSGKESGESLLNIQQQLAERFIDKRKEREKLEEQLDNAISVGQSPIEKQWQDFEDRLVELRLFGIGIENMSSKQLEAYRALEKDHLQKLSKLDADAMKDEIEQRQRNFETGLSDIKLRNSEEINSITSLAQAKEILSETMSNEELQKIRSLDKAKKLLQEQQAIEEEQFAREHLEELLEILRGVMETGEWDSIDLSDSLLSDEEKQLLIDRINEVKKSLSGLTAGEDEKDPALSKIGGMSTDVLGFSPQDWDLLFENLNEGKAKIGDMIMAAKALTKIFESYYDSVSKGEESRYKQYENNINGQKKKLQENLDHNLISQEAYNFQLAELDRELEGRKAQMERRNAVRARNVAIMEAIINTASAVTSALKVAPPLGLVLAGIVGGLGAFQIAKIISTPLPTIEGKEAGGFLDVKRAQDGKIFKAKKDPGKRGFVSTPTIITGEKSGSSEYIVSDVGVNNPTVRPILDILEMARQNGNLATINLPAILESTHTYPGRQAGGYISDITKSVPGGNQSPVAPAQDPALAEIIRQNTIIMAALKARLDKGIKSKVALHGRGGLYEAMDEDAQLKKNANF